MQQAGSGFLLEWGTQPHEGTEGELDGRLGDPSFSSASHPLVLCDLVKWLGLSDPQFSLTEGGARNARCLGGAEARALGWVSSSSPWETGEKCDLLSTPQPH